MPSVQVRPHGWHIVVVHPDASTESHTLSTLDRRFDLALAGRAWEATGLARRVASLSGAVVSVYLNGRLMAAAEGQSWSRFAG